MANIFTLFLLGRELGIEKVWEKQQLDDDKKDEYLDADDEPQRFAHSHTAETIIVEMEHARPESLFVCSNVAHGCEKVN